MAPSVVVLDGDSSGDDPDEVNFKDKKHVTGDDSKKRIHASQENASNECSICFEPYNSLNHRAVAFQCGHIFGEECVKAWLEHRPPSGKICPLDCKKTKRVSKNAVIPLWNLPTITIGDPAYTQQLEDQVRDHQRKEQEKENEIAELKQQLERAKSRAARRVAPAYELQPAGTTPRTDARPSQPLQPSTAVNLPQQPSAAQAAWVQHQMQVAMTQALHMQQHRQMALAQGLAAQASAPAPLHVPPLPAYAGAPNTVPMHNTYTLAAPLRPLCTLHSTQPMSKGRCLYMCEAHGVPLAFASQAQGPAAHQDQQQLLCVPLVQPWSSYIVPLPAGVTMVKNIKAHTTVRQVLVAADSAGLIILDPRQQAAPVHINTRGQVWSCEFAAEQPQVVYAGMDKGKVAVYDIRQAARPLQTVKLATETPVHTLVALPSRTLRTNQAAALPACSMLAAASPYRLWHVSGAEQQLQAQLLPVDHADDHTIGSLAVDESYQQLMLSWRGPATPAMHQLYQLTQGNTGGQRRGQATTANTAAQVNLRYSRSMCHHVNQLHMVRSTFVPPAYPEFATRLFLSATELGNQPQLLDCRDGTLVTHLVHHPTAIKQLAACKCTNAGTIALGVCSESQLQLYTMP